MLKTLQAFLLSLITLASGIITIVLYGRDIFPALSSDTMLAVGLVGLLAGVFLLENLYLRIRWGRSKQYEQVLTVILGGLEEIYVLNHAPMQLESRLRALNKVCDRLAKAYSLISGTNCSACIKILIEGVTERGEQKVQVVTLCRDDDNSKKRASVDTKTVSHWLDDNTDYVEIVRIKPVFEKYFFCNQLPFLFGYRNTSFDVYGLPVDSSNWLMFNSFFRYLRWPLPYKSTIVVPIRPADDPELKRIVGFLCVDSPAMYAFQVRSDVELLIGVAAALFIPIFQLSQLRNNSLAASSEDVRKDVSER